jgi:OmpA-OmpF porin, OOP family
MLFAFRLDEPACPLCHALYGREVTPETANIGAKMPLLADKQVYRGDLATVTSRYSLCLLQSILDIAGRLALQRISTDGKKQMSVRKLALAAIGLSAVAYAPAGFAAPEGPFVGIMGGANFTYDLDMKGRGAGINRSVDTDTGYVVIPSIGYRLSNGMRTEIELGYRKNDVDGVSGSTTGSGEIKARSAMLNLLYDVNMNGRISPYFGGGIGYAKVRYDGVQPVGIPGIGVNDSDRVFAYQGIAGISYAMSNMVELAAEYRYFDTQDPDFRTSAGTPVEGEYKSHAALIGLRFNFGAPKPEPVATPAVTAAAEPAPAPAPIVEPAALPRNFLVFFDFDRSDISAEADTILSDAVAYAKANGAVRIAASGHADRSGSDEYNMALSMRRGNAVKARLLALGVPESEIIVSAKGESEPLVPTEDGVREPQNRRVEIVLQ